MELAAIEHAVDYFSPVTKKRVFSRESVGFLSFVKDRIKPFISWLLP
jgi:hypothetical protein